ncbi:MAG: transcription antitermination factor NusB [Thermoanaerobaculia bacterium]|nr:transcription antitermination factor NusB [Thermoanaerobaculia bacterium]
MAASWVVERTLASSAPVESFLSGVLPRFDERDQGLLRELVLGTLRWLRRVDHVIAGASDRDFERIEPALRAPLRIGTYQLLFLDRIPSYAAVDEAVEQARAVTHRGGASFVNAVLRRIGRDRSLKAWPVEISNPVGRAAVEWSHPDFLVQRWSNRFGWERTRRLLEVNNRPKRLQVLSFRDRGGRGLLAERLIDAGVLVEPCRLSPLGITVETGDLFGSLPFRDGSCYVQDEVSQIVALFPPPEAGERVLDVAAAPGGKTFALLAWEPEVRPLMSEVDPARIESIQENFDRLERRAPVVVSDGSRPGLQGRFDRVVVDLPCSGTGTLRKHPEIKWRLTPPEIDRLAATGSAILEGSAALVEPGGVLLVITCSLEREENEEVVEPFLAGRPEFERIDLRGELPVDWQEGIEAPGRWRLLPEGDHDGFTVHVLRRRG